MKRTKKHAIPIPCNEESYQEALLALKLKRALEMDLQDEIAQMTVACENDPELQRFFQETQPKALRKIQRAADQARFWKFFTTPLPRAAGIAACLILTLFLALGVAVASSKTVRVSLAKYVINVGREYASFGFIETGEFVDVPIEWEGQYYPSYLPEGLELLSCCAIDVEYISADGRDLGFCEMDINGFGTIDTENATINHISINGHAALLIEKGQRTSILWNMGNRSLSVDYTGGRDETIKIAESVAAVSFFNK